MNTENTAAPASPVSYRFGWQALNEMTQGARRGDFVSVGSLPHNYRTNFLLSLTAQLATLNTPVQLPGEEGKRPLILHISAEETQSTVCDILYRYLKAVAQEEPEEDDDEFSDHYVEMARMYVQNKLSISGFNVMTMSVPVDNRDTFSLVSKVLELEACGYSVHAIVADGLLQLIRPSYRLQCIGSGARSALRDLRSFCTMRNILLLASFDLSTQAALLRRNSASVQDFFNRLVTLIDPYAEVKNLAQEVDLELFISLPRGGDKTYLGVRRGKHRTAAWFEEDKRCFFLPFPEEGSPLVQDVDKARISIADMPAIEVDRHLTKEEPQYPTKGSATFSKGAKISKEAFFEYIGDKTVRSFKILKSPEDSIYDGKVYTFVQINSYLFELWLTPDSKGNYTSHSFVFCRNEAESAPDLAKCLKEKFLVHHYPIVEITPPYPTQPQGENT